MRDVNNEKKLKEWMQKQLEKSLPSSSSNDEKQTKTNDNKDYRSVPPPHKFSDAAYDEQKKQIADDMDEAVKIAAELMQAEKKNRKKKSSTAISTNDVDDDNEVVAAAAVPKKRRHSDDALEDGELKNKKTKKTTGADAAFFLGIDVGDVSSDDDEEEEPLKKPKNKK